MSVQTQPMMSGALLTDRFSLQYKLIAVIAGVCALTICSKLKVPMYPVPMSMQTVAVLLIGALYGRVLGSATVGAWLMVGLAGLPVFAGEAAGPAYFTGPTAGYLLGFFVAAYGVGALSDRGWNGMKPHLAFAAMILGSVVIYAFGWAWLATIIGAQKAWIGGVLPFIFGDILKAILAVLLLVGVHKSFTEKFLN